MLTVTVLMVLLLMAVVLLYCAAQEIHHLRQDVKALTAGWNNATRCLDQYKVLYTEAQRELRTRRAA